MNAAANAALFAGPALRRLRKREDLTQAAMAVRLGISASYLNLIERNQRPVSARVMMQLVDVFDFDPRSLREDEAIGGIDGLSRRLSDERFADLGIDREDAIEFLAAVPQAATAFARLYDAAGQGQLAESRGKDTSPLIQSRREIERWRNHFGELDDMAERLADELRLSHADTGVALAERLREKHRLTLRTMPMDVMPERLRRLDLHARQLQLSEMLSPASRSFHVAMQVAQLEAKDTIAALAKSSRLDDTARALFERHLIGYFAAALLMPYGRFLRACEATGYDLPVLQRRFGCSFEQIAHRLTTLQRVGQRGLPFFMARIDRAGQFSKRFAGASNTLLLENDASCPLWIAHRAFERAGHICVQPVAVASRTASNAVGHWLTIARAVDGSGTVGDARFAIVLGVEARLAADLAAAQGQSLRPEDAQPIGLGCAHCHRPNCRQRSLPPQGTTLRFSSSERGLTPFDFEH